MIMCVDDDIYIVNVGDSRAIMSKSQGASVEPLSTDHKPMQPNEYHRITSNGGNVY
jgi:serine/threonine protein phosphatase PrpC